MSSRYRLIGHPLGHSLSPFIHKRLFALSGQTEDYTLYDIAPESLSDAVPALLGEIRGCNVTIPHKQKVLPFIDRLDGKAAVYQTVNCIAVTEDGVIGYNTDADGFLCALREAGIPLSGRVVVIGAGGAGTVLAAEAALAGCEVVIHNAFDHTMAHALKDRLATIAPDAVVTVSEEIPQGHIDLLVNSTPVGMFPKTDACPVPDDLIARCDAVFDAIYNPRKTQLLQKAETAGAKTAGGMAMLVWQAAISHTHWYGASFNPEDIDAVINACYEELKRF